MLTLEETGFTLSFFNICSILNIFPIGVDVKSGKIQMQSNSRKVFILKFLFGVGVSHWFYVFGRFIQSTILEPEKYFRWDHFVLHFGFTVAYAVWYFTAFRLLVKNPEETVIIFNQLFSQREDPVQKMMDQEKQFGMQAQPGNGHRKQVCAISAAGNKPRGKSGTPIVPASAREPIETIQMDVIENGPESESEVRPLPRPLLTWPPQYSLTELMAKLLPLTMVFPLVFIILLLAVDPSRPHLLYSSLPPEWQHVWSFSILLAVEALCLSIVSLTAAFAIVTQLLFFGKCQAEFQRMSLQLRNLEEKFQNRGLGNASREIEREIWILRQVLEEMRELVVLIELFNRCFPFCIFAFKLFSLSICITFYFFAIRHLQHFPVLVAFAGYVAVAITLTYSIMYTDAFSIPGKMDELKREFLLTAQKTTSVSNADQKKALRAEMKREIKKIHGVGIKVGSFHQMERESTPNFVDFVVNQVVSLLVTFPR